MKKPLRNSAVLAVAGAALLAAGCLHRPMTWREERAIPPHFFVREWLMGAGQRVVPIEESFAEAEEENGPPLGEPHGVRMSVRRAQVYLVGEGRRKDFLTQYRYDVRFWPSPEGVRLAVQRVWRDTPIEVVDARGRVLPLPDAALEGLPPTYNEYPLGFVQWDNERRLVAVSIHTPKARGYPFVARWRVDVMTGERALVDEKLLLLSPRVADWRLLPLPQDPAPEQAEAILQPLADSETEWVRQAAQEYLDNIRRLRALEE